MMGVSVSSSTLGVLFLSLMLPSVLAVTPTGKVDFTEADDLLNDDSDAAGGFVAVYKNFPKIQVTVDTQKLKRVSQPETKSDESSSGSSGSSGSESVERPAVGVRTDITIEISEESVNETRGGAGDRDGKRDRNGPGAGNTPVISGGKKDDGPDRDGDNASIPVFKGTAGVTSKPKPTATQGPPGTRPVVTLGHRPTGTNFYGSGGDDRNRISGEYDGGWSGHRYPHTVTAVWTTERPYLRRADFDLGGQHQPTYYKGYIPYNVGHHSGPTDGHHHHSGDWKPCYCSIYQPWAARAPTNPVLPSGPHQPPPSTPPRHKVDNKVDVPVQSQQQQHHQHQQYYRSIHS